MKFVRFTGHASALTYTLVPKHEGNRENSNIIKKAEYNTNGILHNPASMKIDNYTLEISNTWNAKNGAIIDYVSSYDSSDMYAVELYSPATIEIPLDDSFDLLNDEEILEKAQKLINRVDNKKLAELTSFTFYDWKFLETVELKPAV